MVKRQKKLFVKPSNWRKIYKSFVKKAQKTRERIRGFCIYIYIYIYKQLFLKKKKKEKREYIQKYIQPLYTKGHTASVFRGVLNG